jgi:hypothetical protein
MTTGLYVYQRAGDVIVACGSEYVAVDDPWQLVADLIAVIIHAEQVTNEPPTDPKGNLS